MTREPDYVVNVWGDGKPMVTAIGRLYSAAWCRLTVNAANRMPWRITHRIRVYLKPSAQERRE